MLETNPSLPPSSQYMAERGEAIYDQKYRAELEQKAHGKFVAINVATGDAALADTGEEALRAALEKDPAGFFHLVRVGHRAAFDAGWYLSCAPVEPDPSSTDTPTSKFWSLSTAKRAPNKQP